MNFSELAMRFEECLVTSSRPLFQHTLLLREFIASNGLFRLFRKIKKGSEASFWCNRLAFGARFFRKDVPYLILYQWTKFQCHTFFLSHDIKQNMLLSSYLDS